MQKQRRPAGTTPAESQLQDRPAQSPTPMTVQEPAERGRRRKKTPTTVQETAERNQRRKKPDQRTDGIAKGHLAPVLGHREKRATMLAN